MALEQRCGLLRKFAMRSGGMAMTLLNGFDLRSGATVKPWKPRPRQPTPPGMIHCKIIDQDIFVCGMAENCKIKSCKAKGGGNHD